MFLVQQITSDPLQKQILVLSDGSRVQLILCYKPMQLGWFIQELTYQDFTLRGVRVCVSPNILYQWKNKLPFGLACYAAQNREPTQQEDFSSGNANLYILSTAEVVELGRYISGQAKP